MDLPSSGENKGGREIKKEERKALVEFFFFFSMDLRGVESC
jgi:hypothetical protein